MVQIQNSEQYSYLYPVICHFTKVPLLRCVSCGNFSLDGRSSCGLCGGRLVESSRDQTSRAPLPPPIRPSRAKPLAILTISVAVLVEGIILTFLLLSAGLTAFGFFLMGMGTLMVLATLGVFNGILYRSEVLNRTDRWLKRRERRKYSD